MVTAREVAVFVSVILPSLLLALVSADALLVVAEDVLLLSLLQIVFVGVYFYRNTGD